MTGRKLWLSTERLDLYYPHEDDFEAQYNLQSRQDVMQYIGKGARTVEEVQTWLNKQIAHYNKHDFATGLLLNKAGDAVGRAGMIYLDYDDTQPIKEFGYAFFPEYWGQGFATEISKGMLHDIFEKRGFDIVHATTHQDNYKSGHVLEKCGLKRFSQLEVYGSVANLYAISRDEYRLLF